MTFGQRLRQARKKRGYLQKQVAEKLGIHHTTISKYENDQSEPDNEIISDLAKLYGVDIGWLITGSTSEGDKPSETYLDGLTEKILSDIVKETGIDLTIPGNKELIIDLIRVVQSRNISK